MRTLYGGLGQELRRPSVVVLKAVSLAKEVFDKELGWKIEKWNGRDSEAAVLAQAASAVERRE